MELNGQKVDGFLEDMNHMEKLEAIVFERSVELLLYKAFIKEKGLEREFIQLVQKVKAGADKRRT